MSFAILERHGCRGRLGAVEAGELRPPGGLPPDVAEVLDGLDEAELRAVIDYAQTRRGYVHSEVTERTELAEREDVLRVVEQPDFTLVVRTEPAGERDAESLRRKALYRVSEEPRPDGGTKLRWSYLGLIEE